MNSTEEKILQAAEQIFLKHGYDGSRMQAIADLAEINKAMLHYYFRPIINPDADGDVIEYECITKGDQKYINIAAASIIAKDYHDNEIIELVKENPDLNKYDLLKNMGYATLKHRTAIINHGIHELHRKTFSSCAINLSHP